jgi:hypothetical protein
MGILFFKGMGCGDVKMADFRVLPACRENLKDGVLQCTCFGEVWFDDWY